ncbi:MAG: hypothetical protein RRA32_03105 [bacterium]|nr:hypothetical protein [bacterium]
MGFWRLLPWAWSTAVVLVPLYWTLHLWHMVVPKDGLYLWPFLMIDAVILAYILNPACRRAFSAPGGRFRHLSFLPPVMMGAMALYAALAPIVGLFVALALAFAVVIVAARARSPKSKVQSPTSKGIKLDRVAKSPGGTFPGSLMSWGKGKAWFSLPSRRLL